MFTPSTTSTAAEGQRDKARKEAEDLTAERDKALEQVKELTAKLEAAEKAATASAAK